MQYLIYGFDDNGGTSITNYGDAADYTGTANRNMWGGGEYGPFSGSSDKITIPSGTYNTAISAHSWEFYFYVNGRGANGTYEHIWDKAYGGLIIEMQVLGSKWTLTVYRATNAGSAVYWCFETLDFQPDHNYYVQVSGTFGTNPQSMNYTSVHVHVGEDGAEPTHALSHLVDFYKGSGSGWFSDSGQTVMLCNSPANSYNANITLYKVREYTSEALNWDTAGVGDWATDVGGGLITTTLQLDSSDYYPVVGQNVTFTATLTADGDPIEGGSIWIYYTHDDIQADVLHANSDSDGVVSVVYQHTDTDYYFYEAYYDGDATHEPCYSASRVVDVSAGSVNQSITATVINAEAGVKDIVPITDSGWTADPAVVGAEASVLGGTTFKFGADVTPATIAVEAEVIQPYVSTAQHQWIFPGVIEAEASTIRAIFAPSVQTITAAVISAEAEVQWASNALSGTGTANAVTATAEVLAPTVNIEYPEITPYDVVLTDTLSLNAVLTDTLSLNVTLTDSVEFDTIVAEDELP